MSWMNGCRLSSDTGDQICPCAQSASVCSVTHETPADFAAVAYVRDAGLIVLGAFLLHLWFCI